MIKEKLELHSLFKMIQSVVCNLFKALLDDVHELYLQKFQDHKWDMQSSTVPEEQKGKYVSHLMKKIYAMFCEAEHQAGVFFKGNLSMVTNGLLNIHQLIELGFAHHLQHFDTIGESVLDIRAGNLLPCTHSMHILYQQEQSFLVMWGANCVLYEEIEDAIANSDYSWIPKECIPKGVPVREPSYVTLKQTLVWLNKFKGWRLGSTSFYFTQVCTVGHKTKPSVDQVLSHEPVTQNGMQVWLAKYTELVTMPQNIGPVYYPS
ncbi:hypothetical protein FRC08_002080 [Ceratobasidium sp. 394]|nr:hypothetical protein FRC08_002080 [Ceratobasidium sp. 394]